MISEIILNFTTAVGTEYITLAFAGFFLIIIVWGFIEGFL